MVNQVAKACRWSEIENLELRSICVGLECGYYAHQTSPILDYISADVAIRTSMCLPFQAANASGGGPHGCDRPVLMGTH